MTSAAMGKDERAISVSGYVYRGQVKYTDNAFNKTVVYKGKARNHLVEQVETFRVGDKDNRTRRRFSEHILLRNSSFSWKPRRLLKMLP
jgi:hypothetical protein